MRRGAVTGALVCGLAGVLLAGPAAAEVQSQRVFAAKAWTVDVVMFDDGTLSCMADVNQPAGDSLSVWADADGAVRLQFFSPGWDLGEGGTADLEVQIDRRGPWALTNADLYLQSVLFDLPDSDEGTRFLSEVMRGNTLYLRNDRGEGVQEHTLAGSSAAIRALIDCVDALGMPDANPFR
ncbi:MAG TPA: hypothetical protein VLA78_01300 [Paracoccaceae bacterium]|nr:hypothetical protein [Paracoccaceae bacterium]